MDKRCTRHVVDIVDNKQPYTMCIVYVLNVYHTEKEGKTAKTTTKNIL